MDVIKVFVTIMDLSVSIYLLFCLTQIDTETEFKQVLMTILILINGVMLWM